VLQVEGEPVKGMRTPGILFEKTMGMRFEKEKNACLGFFGFSASGHGGERQ
jgi:hypothetical protein